jgi:hypothetical protein
MSNHPRTLAVVIFVLVTGCLSAGSVMLSSCASVSAPPSMPDDSSAKAQKPCPQGQSPQDCKSPDSH